MTAYEIRGKHLPTIDEVEVVSKKVIKIENGMVVPEGLSPVETAVITHWVKVGPMKHEKVTEIVEILGQNGNGDILYRWKNENSRDGKYILGEIRKENLLEYW